MKKSLKAKLNPTIINYLYAISWGIDKEIEKYTRALKTHTTIHMESEADLDKEELSRYNLLKSCIPYIIRSLSGGNRMIKFDRSDKFSVGSILCKDEKTGKTNKYWTDIYVYTGYTKRKKHGYALSNVAYSSTEILIYLYKDNNIYHRPSTFSFRFGQRFFSKYIKREKRETYVYRKSLCSEEGNEFTLGQINDYMV